MDSSGETEATYHIEELRTIGLAATKKGDITESMLRAEQQEKAADDKKRI